MLAQISKQTVSRIVVNNYLYGISLIITITNAISRIYAQQLQPAHREHGFVTDSGHLSYSLLTDLKERTGSFPETFPGCWEVPTFQLSGTVSVGQRSEL